MVAASALVPAVATPLLSVSGLSVRYGSLQALDGVNLTVRPGELVALAGENGAGKTTLVRCIAGDISPTQGEIFLSGRRAASWRAGYTERSR
jgi:simple sugar transport system ATP-binding protein